ncbi:alpha/beta fold hydrolase [Nocardia sp. NRRL S-836]|uniref:alpha/beta fold hydrolase n=1 Tax=Nocardia sp. NRRL S-836 TaxID=1519492 RepID=UPI0006AE7417|nr:alpha/beta hydrolase [Nocardia sp. NRRL S-836]KOV85182.1 alpha/beta hydrolase [Nocardia sp. NRRL S-836]
MISRRQFSQAIALTAAAVPLTRAVAHASTPAWGPVKQVRAGLLDVGYAELGPADGPVTILLHGWPYDIHSYVDVAPALAAKGHRVLVPYLRGYGSTRFLHARTFRNGQQSALAADVIAFMDALKIREATLAGFDWGARTACVTAALWPQRVRALVSVSGYLVVNLTQNQEPLSPQAELGWWYQYYFATERGVKGYTQNTAEFNKLIWKLASPKWDFDDATYGRSATAWHNPDHVAIVIHNYRWRLRLAEGEHRYDGYERELAAKPVIGVPTITIASDFDGANADGTGYRKQFSGPYEHRVLTGIGHNVPQEAPEAFTRAVLDV